MDRFYHGFVGELDKLAYDPGYTVTHRLEEPPVPPKIPKFKAKITLKPPSKKLRGYRIKRKVTRPFKLLGQKPQLSLLEKRLTRIIDESFHKRRLTPRRAKQIEYLLSALKGRKAKLKTGAMFAAIPAGIIGLSALSGALAGKRRRERA